MSKAILAYSCSLNASVAIHWIKANYGLDVVTLTIDLSQANDLAGIERKPRRVGTVNHYSLDTKHEFTLGR
jgi:argininosuccinate synthase